MKTIKTIDMTPTWRALMPALVEVAVRGTDADGRKAAMDELNRLADFVDKRNSEAKKSEAESMTTPPLLFVALIDVDTEDESFSETILVEADNSGHAHELIDELYSKRPTERYAIRYVSKVDKTIKRPF